MRSDLPVILVTGATGQLGTLVIEKLLKTVPAGCIVAGVRDTAAATAHAARGAHVRVFDHDRPETLDAAFAGVDRVLLISSNAVDRRLRQHVSVTVAAARTGVSLPAYTSILHADTSPLLLAEEHRATEAALRDPGLPFVPLRNGRYIENITGFAAQDLERGVRFGCAGAGRVSAATRADHAEAAAAVLSAANQAGRIYDLADDSAFTMADYVAELSRQSGRPVSYRDMPQAEFRQALIRAGRPEALATAIADADAGASRGALFDEGGQLRALIGRPTTTLARVVADQIGGALREHYGWTPGARGVVP